MDEEFQDPNIGIHKVYTRGGDKGDTSLVGGQRIAKDHLRIQAYGDVDELNACVGLAAETLEDAALVTALRHVQHQLFNVGSILATETADIGPKQPRITAAQISNLEAAMDMANKQLPPLTSFVLPGGSLGNAALHLSRTVCRRAERNVVSLQRAAGGLELELQYLNRLSDALFVWSRTVANEEILWDPNA